jgi:transcriptional regulator with XRE-family HTH domain
MSIEENKTKFFTNIRRIREEQGQSIENLAKQSGVSVWILQQLEQNILPEEMMVDDACKLAKALHCKTHELFE